MLNTPRQIQFSNQDETAAFAARLGVELAEGDVILLSGEIGSGKTHFARSLIQSTMLVPEDVPSPTFTLVQIYETQRGEIWHADLYRLASIEEIEELGLDEAFSSSICLIEWPDKLGPLRPRNALHLHFEADQGDDNRRSLKMDWTDEKWSPMIESAL